MTAWGSRLPFSLDPLIAEAKRRMRRRRLFVAAMLLVLVGAALGAALALSGSASSGGSAVGGPSSSTHGRALSGLAVRRAFCGNRYSSCHSPDGKWSVVYVNRSAGPVSYNYTDGQVSGYEPPRVGCTLMVTHLATGQKEQIHLRLPGCDRGLWIGRRYVVQDPALGAPSRLMRVDLRNRHVQVLAHFGSDVVSPDERWIAGDVQLPHNGPWPMVAVVSLASHTCRIVAQATAPDQVSVDRSPWERGFAPFGSTGPKKPIVWRTVVQGGKRLRVVTGPGTGFTRNSRSIIVAEWQTPSRAHWSQMAIHKRLVKFNLSALHTPCPTGVAPRG